MKLLQEMSWYEQSKAKLNYAKNNINKLAQQNQFSIDDQITINLLLNVIKAPMEYSTREIQKINGLKEKEITGNIPKKYLTMDMRTYIKDFKKKIGSDNQKLLDIYLKFQTTDKFYLDFEEMQNHEKHTAINVHTKRIVAQTFDYVDEYNNVFKNITVIGSSNPMFTGISTHGKDVQMSETTVTSIVEDIYFEYNNCHVFDFLNRAWDISNTLVDDVANYIQQKNLSSDNHKTRQADK